MIFETHFEKNGKKLVQFGVGYDDLVKSIANLEQLKNLFCKKLKKENKDDAKELEHDFDVAIQAMTMLAVGLIQSQGEQA